MFLLVLIVLSSLVAAIKDDSEDTPSKLTKGYLKSKSIGRDLSYSSSFGSEDFDSPDVPSDFHAKWGINKTWGMRTPHPILSRRVSFENYGRKVVSKDSFATSQIDTSELFSSSAGLERSSTRPVMTAAMSRRGWANSTKTESAMNKPLRSVEPAQTPVQLAEPARTSTLSSDVAGKENTQFQVAVTKKVLKPLEESKEEKTQSSIVTTRQSSELSKMSTIKPTDPPELTAEENIHLQKTTATVRYKTRTWGPALPKMKKQKRRRGSTIVLKPPPEDWPEPKMPGGAMLSTQPDIGATIPPMGTHIDTKLGRKALNTGVGSLPYMGHRKIDFAPQYDKTTLDNHEDFVTQPSLKWRIRGRRERVGGGVPWQQRGTGYQVDLTKKPSVSKFFIPENTTFLIPTVRNPGTFQRSYFNFRMRPPMNIGRSFGPPGHPFPQPPPPPRFVPNHPYGQHPYPQYPPGPPYPRPPPPPPYGPPHTQFGPPHPHYNQGPPLPPFGQGMSPRFRQPPIPPHQPPYRPFPTPMQPQPRGPPDLFPDRPPPAPPSPYPTGPDLPPVRPFLEDIPTISPIDDVPAPWPRRQINWEYRAHRVPEFLRQEPKNFSGYKGPRRGQGYEQYGKVDLRPRHVKLYDHFGKVTPRIQARKGSGFGAHFQEDITRPSYVPGEMFGRRTWPTRSNRYGYEPYRRTSDRKRPYGYGRFAAERPPVLGDFGDYKPYRRLDDTKYVPFNFSRPTRSYTFPPRLRNAIRNATFQRRAFHRSGYRGFTLPTLPSIGLEAFLAHDTDFYGNPITPKGRIFNLQDLKKLFTSAPDVTNVSAVAYSATTPVSVLLSDVLKARITPKPKGMTAREAMRAAAREAIKEAELEAFEAGENVGRRGMRRGLRGLGGSGGRGGKVIRRGGARGSGRSPMNFRRVKRSVDEEATWAEKRRLFKRELYSGEDYLTGPGAGSSSSSACQEPRIQVPLRMRRWHLWRRKGRPLCRARG